MEEHGLGWFRNSELRKMFGSKWDKVAGGGGDCIEGSVTVCRPHQRLFA
jgi:hypothetical protein